MSVIANEHAFPGDVFKHEYTDAPAYTRKVITYNGAAKSFVIGDLVEANGAAADAVADIVGVVRFPATAALNTATPVVVTVRGPASVRAAGLKLGGLDAAQVAAKLEALGIQVLAD
jgi:hypothetical protein